MDTAFNPFVGWAACAESMAHAIGGFWKRAATMPRLLETVGNVRVGATPYEVAYHEHTLRVLHYRSDVDKQYRTPLLFVFALVNRPYILDLMPHKSVVRRFLDRGFDVYMIDWGVPSHEDRGLGLEDYVDGYMQRVVSKVCRRAGVEDLSILGYCMGGSMSAMYTALHPSRVKNLMLMAAPVDFDPQDSLLAVWTDAKYFDVDAFVNTFGNAPPQWLQSTFAMLKPVANLIEKYLTFYEKMDDDRFVEEFFAMETWVNDNIPVAGETFRQFVKYCFQQNLLVQGKLPIGDRLVNLGDIRCPILNLVATNDHLVPCGQSLPFNDLVASTDRRSISFPAGHIGLAVGGRALRDLWPKACDWLAERSEPIRG